LNQKDLVITL